MSKRPRLRVTLDAKRAGALALKAMRWYYGETGPEIEAGLEAIKVLESDPLSLHTRTVDFVFKWGDRYFRNVHGFFSVRGDLPDREDAEFFCDPTTPVKFIEVFPEVETTMVYR